MTIHILFVVVKMMSTTEPNPPLEDEIAGYLDHGLYQGRDGQGAGYLGRADKRDPGTMDVSPGAALGPHTPPPRNGDLNECFHTGHLS